MDSTLIIITAKHGQSPIDTQRYVGITSSGPVTTSPSRLIDNCLPPSESNAGGQIGPTEDDISLLWLKPSCNAAAGSTFWKRNHRHRITLPALAKIFFGQSINQLFNPPGIPPNGDPRSPDIAVAPNVGVTYSGSTAKRAEHGGFSHDDTNVMILVSNPNIAPKTLTTPVQTAQVAPTVLHVLGLNPQSLQAVRTQGTEVLPGIHPRKK